MQTLPIDHPLKKELFGEIFEEIKVTERLTEECDQEQVKFCLNNYFNQLTKNNWMKKGLKVLKKKLIKFADEFTDTIESINSEASNLSKLCL